MIYATPMPPCQIVFAWKEMLLGMDSTEEESGIHYSIVAGPDIYDANAITTIGKGDGTKITGAFQGYGDQMIITKSNSVHPVSVRLTGEAYPAYIFSSPRQLTKEHGCDSHRGIVEAAGNYYLWWKGQLYRYKGVGTERVSYLFDPPSDAANGPTIASVNNARAYQVVGSSLRGRNICLWSYPDGSETENSHAIILDYIENGVTFVEGMSAATAMTLRDDAGVESLLTSTYTGRILEQDKGTTFDGTDIPGRVTLPWMHFQDRMVSWHEAHVSYDTQTSGTLLVEYRIARHEREFDAAVWVQAAEIDMSATAEYGRVPLGEIAPWCQLRVRTTASPFTLYWPVRVLGADLGILT